MSHILRLRLRWLLSFLLLLSLASGAATADEFTVVDEQGASETFEARLAGSGQGFFALEEANGRMRVVPEGAVKDRQTKDGPEPIDAAGMLQLLRDEFGADRVEAMVSDPYIAAVVLAGPLEKSKEARLRAYLRTAASFLANVDKVFAGYARLMKFPLDKPRFPLVMLVFEQDSDFEKYAQDVTQGRTLSAGNIAGFYSGMTNWLAVRMSECFTFEVPLHEAIHQQVYNRGVFQRLAPIPAWFNEGIATGFENEGERIGGNPSKINPRYARQSRTATTVSWADLVEDDAAFRGDVLAGEAYTHAWCLHWMLATAETDSYRRFVQELSQRDPLAEISGEERLAHFQAVFGKNVGDVQQEFPRQLVNLAKRQKVNFAEDKVAGYSETLSGPAEVQLEAVSRVDQGGVLYLRGTVENKSPFRDWMLYVTVVTDSGAYADWQLPLVRAGQKVTLPQQTASKRLPGSSGGGSRTFRVRVFAALPGSATAKSWQNGDLPTPLD
ncbi:MAG: DUF1570 domain-containing protein [Planctomycetaceae bacterium]|nr:DUF1570 domain-containing protein [Planctomycetaceae bacterium]